MSARTPAPAWPAGRGDLGASLALIFPLVLIYAIGVLVTGRVTGSDLVSRGLLAIVGGSRAAYLLIYAVAAIAFLVWLRRTHRREALSLAVAGPVILEAAIYAFTLGTVIGLVLDHLPGLGISAPALTGAVGAGVHEELVFRLGIMAGLVAWLAPSLGHRGAVALAIVLSSLAFAAAHHAGARGEAWSTYAFAFRCCAGIAFAAMFWFRSFAHAVYAHVLYDVLVVLKSS